MTRKTSTKRAIEGQIRQVVDGGNDDLARARARRATRQSPTPTPPPSSLPSEAEYERRSFAEARRRLEEVNRAPLADRKEAQANFLAAMRGDPRHVAESIDWLIDGHYGYGEMMTARRILASPRMNRAAALTHLIGALEWSSPDNLSRAAWHQLSAKEQTALDTAVQEVIRRAEAAAAEQ